jgi:putative endopeptidase
MPVSAATPVPREVMPFSPGWLYGHGPVLGGAVNRTRLLAGMLVALMGGVAACASAPPPLRSGLLLPGYNRQVRAQDDLFQFANGAWLRTTEIPADRSQYGAFIALADQAETNLRAIVEDSAARRGAAGSPDQRIGDFYASFMDTARVNALGAAPLKESLDRIDALATPAELARYFGESSAKDIPSPLALYINQDAKNASAYLPNVWQSGLTLPDRDYYLKSDPQYVTIRDKLRAYAARMLGLAGVADPDGSASRVFALENRLAKVQWTAARERDATATYNKYTVADATARTPGLDWKTYLDAAGVHTTDFVAAEPSYFTALGAALTSVPLADWKPYLKFKLIDDLAPYLSDAFVTARFEFRSRDLTGQQEMRPRWKRGVAAVDNAMGDLLGQRYVQRYFPPDAKQRIDALVSKLIDAYRSSIDGLDWMSDATKAQARDKLSKLAVKIGYPDKWKDYSKLTVARDDLVGNVLHSAQLEHQRDLDKLGKPVDRAEWFVTPQTVNAFYHPSRNEITFPAAILQPPFFDANADDAVNYGGIGGVIGHEISHAFDDQGRKFDGTGNLRDWWTPRDVQRFTDRTAALTAQYSAYEPLPGVHVKGKLTMGENIADLSGLQIAYKAWKISLGGKPSPVIDGLTGEQRFYYGFSQAWREKDRDEAMLHLVTTNPHSPPQFRADGASINSDGFHEAFETKPGDKMWKAPADRIRLW